jgi:hypothetical protein
MSTHTAATTARPAAPAVAPSYARIVRDAAPPPAGIVTGRWATTVGRMQLGIAAIVAAGILMVLATGAAVMEAQEAMQTIGVSTAPSIISAQKVKAAMANMDANAANYLLGDKDQNELANIDYDRESDNAYDGLIDAAANITLPEERTLVQNLLNLLADYTADIGAARQMHALGDRVTSLANYRTASALMAEQILPTADRLDAINRAELDAAYARQERVSKLMLAIVAGAGLLLIGTLVALQRLVTARTRRAVNPQLAAATVIALLLLARLLQILVATEGHVKNAGRDAFPSIHALWQARAISYLANAQESQFLLDSERRDFYTAAFQANADQLGKLPAGVTYAQIAATAGDARNPTVPKDFTGLFATELRNITYGNEERVPATETVRAYGQYVELDKKIRDLELAGRHAEAVALCIGYGEGQSNMVFGKFDAALGATIDVNQAEFDKAVDAGLSATRGFTLWALGAVAAIVVLTIWGMSPRLAEYRV